MKSVRKRITYANVMSTIAVFLVVAGGSALAAGTLGKNTVGTKQLKNNAVTGAKIKNAAVAGGKLANGAVTSAKLGGGAVGAGNLAANAVTGAAIADGAVSGAKIANGAIGGAKIANGAVSGDKIANGAVSGDKIAGGAVGAGNLANGSVTREKLAAGERSEVLQFQETASTVELAHGITEPGTKIMAASLPAGQWIVTASVNLIYSIEAESSPNNASECFLTDDGTTIGEGGSTYRVGLFFFAGTASMTGVSDGGTISIQCKSFNKNSFGATRQIIATRVGSVNGAS
jgi:hypothetical protein